MKPAIALTRAIQEAGPHTEEDAPDALAEGCVLTSWVLVSEWVDIEGSRWLTRADGNAAGESLPDWQREGLLHNALYGNWRAEET